MSRIEKRKPSGDEKKKQKEKLKEKEDKKSREEREKELEEKKEKLDKLVKKRKTQKGTEERIIEPESIKKAREVVEETTLKSEADKVKKGIVTLTGEKGEVKNLEEAVKEAKKVREKLYEEGKIDKEVKNSLAAGSGEEQVIRTAKVLDEIGEKEVRGKKTREGGDYQQLLKDHIYDSAMKARKKYNAAVDAGKAVALPEKALERHGDEVISIEKEKYEKGEITQAEFERRKEEINKTVEEAKEMNKGEIKKKKKEIEKERKEEL